MDRGEREARVRMLLEGMARRPLYKLARRLDATAYAGILKDELIDLLADVSTAALCNGLAGGVSARDLQQLCAQLGYSKAGSALQLATRLCDAVERSDARVTRWRQFEEARSFARRLQLHSQAEWFAFARGRMPTKGELPDDIPRKPEAAYADCWSTWGDFLGTGNPSRRDVRYRPFAEALPTHERSGLRTRRSGASSSPGAPATSACARPISRRCRRGFMPTPVG